MANEPRTIKGPCFDCDDAIDDAWEYCTCRKSWSKLMLRTELTTGKKPLISMTDYKRGTYAAAGIIALLVVLCVLASLSGCLTAAKIAAWQGMVYGWGMDSSAPKPCQVASAKASAYLANANQRLAEAGKLTDLASDGQAKQLVNSAALACGKKVQ